MRLLLAASLLVTSAFALSADTSPVTETLTRYVFTCPCDDSSWTSTHLVSHSSSTGSDLSTPLITSQSTTLASTRYVNNTSSSSTSTSTIIHITSASTTITSSTSAISSTTISPLTTTISTTVSSSPSSTTRISSTSAFYIAVSTSTPVSRKRQTTLEYLAFDADGQSSLVNTEAEATILTVDVDGNLITNANPVQYVAFSSTTPTVLVLQNTAPTDQVSITFNSDGSLSINGIASQCELNDQLVVSTDGTTPDGCTPVSLAADNIAGERSTTTSAAQYTTSCTSSTSTTVFAPGSTGTNVAVACAVQLVTSTTTAVVSFVSGCTTSSSTTLFANGSTGTNVAVACSMKAVTLS